MIAKFVAVITRKSPLGSLFVFGNNSHGSVRAVGGNHVCVQTAKIIICVRLLIHLGTVGIARERIGHATLLNEGGILAATVAMGMSNSSASSPTAATEGVATLATLSAASPSEAGSGAGASAKSESGSLLPLLAVLGVIAAGPFVRKALRP